MSTRAEYPFESLVNPRDLPPPLSVFGLKPGKYMVEEIKLNINDIPFSAGRVSVRLADKDSVTFDLAWGAFGEVGSIRACYFVEFK